jgi:hypothetical protein
MSDFVLGYIIGSSVIIMLYIFIWYLWIRARFRRGK